MSIPHSSKTLGPTGPDGSATRATPALEAALSRALTAGVIAAAAVAVTGAGMYLRAHGGETVRNQAFIKQPHELAAAFPVIRAALNGEPRAIMQASILILIATPVLRVALSLVLFAIKRDRLYVGITMVVLALLAIGLLGVAA